MTVLTNLFVPVVSLGDSHVNDNVSEKPTISIIRVEI